MDPLNQNAEPDGMDSSQQVPSPADNSQPTAASNTPQAPQTWQEAMTHLLHGFGTWAQTTNQSQEAISTTMQALTAQIATLSTQVPTATWSTATAATPTAPSRSVRVKEPRQFTGKASDVEAFLDEITNNLYLQRRQITTDYEQSLFLSLYLTDGNPKSWYQAIRSSTPDLLHDFDGFVEDFRRHFGDSDLESTAYCKIKALRQTGSCAAYASRFRELVVYLDWTDKSKIAAFKEGLKDQVHDLLITVCPKPTHFDDFVKTCIEIDNAVHENELEKRHAKSGDASKNTNRSHPKQNQPSTGRGTATMSAPSLSTPTLPPGEPMMIDATKTKRGPLTQAERDRRRANKLCMYCGGQHQIDACPNMSDAAKKRLADKKTTSPSLGKA